MTGGKRNPSTEKTRTSVVLGNDYYSKKTTYQSEFKSNREMAAAVKTGRPQLAEVLPHQVYPPPTEALKRTIYQEDFAVNDFRNTSTIYREQHKRMIEVAGTHKLVGVPLSPHPDMKNKGVDPSQQQTAYSNRTKISSDWACVQISAQENGLDPAMIGNKGKAEAYEKLPTEHQRQFRWPLPDDIHVVTYQHTKC